MQAGSGAVVLTAAPQALEELCGEKVQWALQGSLCARMQRVRGWWFYPMVGSLATR